MAQVRACFGVSSALLNAALSELDLDLYPARREAVERFLQDCDAVDLVRIRCEQSPASAGLFVLEPSPLLQKFVETLRA